MPSKKDVYIEKLRKTIRSLISQKEVLISEKEKLEERLKLEINNTDNHGKPPMIVGVIVKLLDQNEGKVLVASSTDPLFVVNLSNEIRNKQIKPGMIVALNQRTFEVMEILPVTNKEIKKSKRNTLSNRV
ncbi:MAG: hypothetical protein ACFE9Z_09740 [Promethearchaeota archaeon]